MTFTSTQPILPIVLQHVEESLMLRHQRHVVLRRPDVRLPALVRFDERLAAHLDGIAVAGVAGQQLVQALLDEEGPAALFVATVGALQARDAALLPRLVDMAEKSPQAERALLSALGWVSAQDLQGTVRALLGSKVAAHRAWGLSACAMHGVDPGPVLLQAEQDASVVVRAHAWCAAARVGRVDLADAARRVLSEPHAHTVQHDEHATVLIDRAASHGPARDRVAAACALALWGQAGHPLVQACLLQAVGEPTNGEAALPSEAAHRLLMMSAPLDWGREQIRALGERADGQPALKRRMMRMAAWLGDVQIVPWLIHHLADEQWARLAGESLTLITGLDCGAAECVRDVPGQPVATATEEAQDADVAMDEDDNLPWPDQAKVQAWWRSQGGRFATGQRHFCGAPVSRHHALTVLRQGGQGQRAMAALHLCLLQPEAGLFSVFAPAWRQLRALSQREARAA